MFDIDFFKAVNDQYGHLAGDMVIREFGRLLRRSFTRNSIVARLGGEEFVCLQSGGEDDATEQTLKVFLETTRNFAFSFRGMQIHITLSIGLTKLLPGQSLEGLMRNVDRALYQSKEMGRDRITVLY